MEHSHEEMVNKIVMWRDALEKGYGMNTVFDSMCVYLGEQQREIEKLNQQVKTMKHENKKDDTLSGHLKKLDRKLMGLALSDSSIEYAPHIREEFDSVICSLNYIKQHLGAISLILNKDTYFDQSLWPTEE